MAKGDRCWTGVGQDESVDSIRLRLQCSRCFASPSIRRECAKAGKRQALREKRLVVVKKRKEVLLIKSGQPILLRYRLTSYFNAIRWL